MKNEEIIQVLKSCLDREKDMHRYYWKRGHYCDEDNALWEVTTRKIDALAEAVETFEQLYDDEPLTLDQLQHMVGCPVWIEEFKQNKAFFAILNTAGDTGFFVTTAEILKKHVAYSLYGVTWRAYAGFHSPVSRWICVNDQMPDSGEWVLVCWGTFVCEAYCDINGYFHRIPQERWPDADSPYPITHWMPLPEPPASVVSTVYLEEDTHD